jgi:hypothetical protein
MGEIKSTLDLVMEKTRNLTLSSEEKAEQKFDEIHKQVKGFLLKYQDKVINKNQLKKAIEALRKNHGSMADDILLRELLATLKLDLDNDSHLDLLHEFCGSDIHELKSIFKEYKELMLVSGQKRIHLLKEDLASKGFISGSAVLPNLEADNVWIAEVRKIKAKFEKRLQQETKQLSKT